MASSSSSSSRAILSLSSLHASLSANESEIEDVKPAEGYRCIHKESGRKITIPKSVLVYFPFLQKFFDPHSPFSKSHFLESSNEYVLPSQLHPQLLNPILAFCDKKRFFKLFLDLPTEFSAFQLAELLDFLGFDISDLGTEDELKSAMKNLHDDIGKHGIVFTKADRSKARDAAVKYCLMLILKVSENDLRSNGKLRNSIYQQLLFIISHSKTFFRRIRYHTWTIANELKGLNLSAKQLALMQKSVPTAQAADEPFDYQSDENNLDDGFQGYYSD